MNNCCNNIYPSEDMNRWESCPSTMLANADNYYNKNQIDEKLEEIVISGGGITSGEVQSMIDASVEPIEGSVEALSGAVEQLSTDMENKADKSDIPSLENYYDKTEVNNLLDTKLDASAYTPTDLSSYWTSAQTKNYVDNAISGIPSNILAVDWEDLMENMNDDKWDELVDAFQNNNPIYAIVDYSGEGFIDIDQKPIDGYVFIDGNTGEQGSRIELKRLTSDGYDWITITKNGSNNYTVTNGNVQYTPTDLSNYWTSAQTQSAITQAVSGKADASDVYTKTEVYNKTEVNNLISNKANVWCGDETSFNALTNKDANTIYLVY